jgi:hypothetical protein
LEIINFKQPQSHETALVRWLSIRPFGP